MKDTLGDSSCTCIKSHHCHYTDGTERHSRHYTALFSSFSESKSIINPTSTPTALLSSSQRLLCWCPVERVVEGSGVVDLVATAKGVHRCPSLAILSGSSVSINRPGRGFDRSRHDWISISRFTHIDLSDLFIFPSNKSPH